ncbi:MAG TPA: hypothetical protein VGM98_07890 [Schlesneria sp.]
MAFEEHVGASLRMAKKRVAANKVAAVADRVVCGLAMPISGIEGLGTQHWLEVRDILTQAIDTAGFDTLMVSEANDSGIIQARIVQNLYERPIAVVDVSCKNPNVMFELGMRLAFDKPTVVVKDDSTQYSFDSSPIEHLEYPRDLRFGKINDFKTALAAKVRATFDRSSSDANYSTYLKHFTSIVPAKLQTTEVSKEDFIIRELGELRALLLRREPDPDLIGSENSFIADLLVGSIVVWRNLAVVINDQSGPVRERTGSFTAISGLNPQILSDAGELTLVGHNGLKLPIRITTAKQTSDRLTAQFKVLRGL